MVATIEKVIRLPISARSGYLAPTFAKYFADKASIVGIEPNETKAKNMQINQSIRTWRVVLLYPYYLLQGENYNSSNQTH